ncbi:AAA family ATPase [Streptomyces lonarensis]|uniref:ABC transporter n=1 Tax=Streptomyces lonarensis TaxID=700599 RepID=A0A7X6D2M7_9ACTN|nr:AAA family ATPase [Streptomyces lonarensis]NJQ07042.1 ABC transporter [Streptomyces lonarensis]
MIVERAYAHVPPEQATDWPWTVPCVRELLSDGLRFTAPVTFLVGENGSGKSTLVEALAEGYGLDPWGGSAGHRYAGSRERSPLGERVRFEAAAGGRRMLGSRTARRGFFLRAETARDALDREGFGPDFRSHGEGFLAAFRDEFRGPGLFVLDEPEAALSFTSCLELVGHLAQVVEHGGQVVCATHSPLLTAMPGAEILELDEDGLRRVAWEELRLVDHWRRYLADPRSYLRHVLE